MALTSVVVFGQSGAASLSSPSDGDGIHTTAVGLETIAQRCSTKLVGPLK